MRENHTYRRMTCGSTRKVVLACLCLRDRNGFLGNIVPVEACKLIDVHPTLRAFPFTTQEGWNVNGSPGCLKISSHMELRHDLRTPPRAEHDGILQSDEA